MEITAVSQGLIMTQRKFSKELLATCNMNLSKTAKTPLPAGLKLSGDCGALCTDPVLYRSLVGKLNFLTHTRPDLCYAVQTLSQYMHQPRVQHHEALHHVLRYLAGSLGQGILLAATDQLTLKAYSDSDWASCPDTRRSVTGYVMLLGSSPISWKSKKQATVSKSFSEAEYRAMSAAASEITWLVRLLQELGVPALTPVKLLCDNQSAIHIGRNPVLHERTKHIELDCHFTREKVMEGLLELSYLPTQDQLADLFTKALNSPQHMKLSSKLGLIEDQSLPSLRGGVDMCNSPPNDTTT